MPMWGRSEIADRCGAFAELHDDASDAWAFSGALWTCPHFPEFIESLEVESPLTDEQRAVLALDGAHIAQPMQDILRLFDRAALPPDWLGAIEVLAWMPHEHEMLFVAKSALYGLIAERLTEGVETRADALELANLVEGTTALEDVWIEVAGAHNAIPMGIVGGWWPTYLACVNGMLTGSDLAELSAVAGGFTVTEAMSARTSADRLAVLFRTGTLLAAANPNLPAEAVAEALDDEPLLAFHPNANIERAWVQIERMLEDQNEELLEILRPFENLRDDGWLKFVAFPSGDHARELRQRIRAWAEIALKQDEDDEFASELILNVDLLDELSGDEA